MRTPRQINKNRLRVFAAAGLALALSGCAATKHEAPAEPAIVPSAPTPVAQGRRFDVVSPDSLLTIRVYRAGTLARMGHNHLIASHDLSGSASVPEDLTAASFELHVPVSKLTVDEETLRKAEGNADFAAAVPDSAREGTRRNMLGASQLDGEHYPEIVLKSGRIDVAAPNELLAQVQITVRDRTTAASVPVHYEIQGDSLVASGELALKQSDLGLTPLSIMMGAIAVQDEMKIRFSVRCVATQPMSANQ
jgi:polyisoprenoid-binding protein YceI